MDRHFDDAALLTASNSALRRLARRLVADEHAADDLVQDTWLAALQRSGRAILGQTGLRVALRRNAISAWRRQREDGALPDDLVGAGDPGDALALLEHHRILHGELRALREPYRSTLIERYFRERRAEEIAAAEGVPTATVRTRITRGLKFLREALDRRYDDGEGRGRAAWMAALTPRVAERAGLSVAFGLVAATVVGVTIWGLAPWMGTRRGEALPEDVIARLSRDAATLAPSDVLAAVSQPRADAPTRAQPPESVGVPAAVDAAEPEAATALPTIRGVAVDALGRPVEGIAYGAAPPAGSTSFHRAPRTGPNGEFEVVIDDGSFTSWHVSFAVLVEQHGAGPSRDTLRLVGALRNARPGSRGHVVTLDIDDLVGGRVVGMIPELRAVHQSGDTSGARVLLCARPAMRGPEVAYSIDPALVNERFEFTGVRPGTYALTVGGGGLRSLARTNIEVRSGETTDVGDLTYADLGRAVITSALANGQGGQAAPDLLVGSIVDADGLFSFVSAEFGERRELEVEFTALSAGDWTLTWATPGFAIPRTSFHVDAGETVEIAVVARRTRDVEVQVDVPEISSVGEVAWGAVTFDVRDEQGRILVDGSAAFIAKTDDERSNEPRTVAVPVPIDGVVEATFRTDTGREARVTLDERALRGGAARPAVDLR